MSKNTALFAELITKSATHYIPTHPHRINQQMMADRMLKSITLLQEDYEFTSRIPGYIPPTHEAITTQRNEICETFFQIMDVWKYVFDDQLSGLAADAKSSLSDYIQEQYIELAKQMVDKQYIPPIMPKYAKGISVWSSSAAEIKANTDVSEFVTDIVAVGRSFGRILVGWRPEEVKALLQNKTYSEIDQLVTEKGTNGELYCNVAFHFIRPDKPNPEYTKSAFLYWKAYTAVFTNNYSDGMPVRLYAQELEEDNYLAISELPPLRKKAAQIELHTLKKKAAVELAIPENIQNTAAYLHSAKVLSVKPLPNGVELLLEDNESVVLIRSATNKREYNIHKIANGVMTDSDGIISSQDVIKLFNTKWSGCWENLGNIDLHPELQVRAYDSTITSREHKLMAPTVKAHVESSDAPLYMANNCRLELAWVNSYKKVMKHDSDLPLFGPKYFIEAMHEVGKTVLDIKTELAKALSHVRSYLADDPEQDALMTLLYTDAREALGNITEESE